MLDCSSVHLLFSKAKHNFVKCKKKKISPISIKKKKSKIILTTLMVIHSYLIRKKHLQISETQFWDICINLELNQHFVGFKKGSSWNSRLADKHISAEGRGRQGEWMLHFFIGPKVLTPQRDTSKANMQPWFL